MDRAKRKLEHLEYTKQTIGSNGHGLDDIRFVHQSLPNINLDSITIETVIGELSLSSPIIINAMTGGGGSRTLDINRQLAEIADQCGLAMAVGSQMAAIHDPSQTETYRIVRKVNPKGVIFANIGSEATVDQALQSIDMIEADGLQIHLNIVQELVMPEGDRNFHGRLKNIEQIVKYANVPVVIKEVGFGISREMAEKLMDVGVSIVDIGGYGGTNFSEVENIRREKKMEYFNVWGIPTAASIAEVKQKYPLLDIVASGGISNALDIAKSVALGANAVGMAGHFLKMLMDKGMEHVIEEILSVHEDLKIIMTALGTQSIETLKKAPVVIFGDTSHWLKERGVDTTKYSKRIFQGY